MQRLCPQFFVVYPAAAVMPGPNNGVFEDLDNTLAQLQDNPTLVALSVVFCVSVFALNSMVRTCQIWGEGWMREMDGAHATRPPILAAHHLIAQPPLCAPS